MYYKTFEFSAIAEKNLLCIWGLDNLFTGPNIPYSTSGLQKKKEKAEAKYCSKCTRGEE